MPPILFFGCFLFLLGPGSSSDEIGKDWTTVKRGTSMPPIDFAKDGTISFREGPCRVEVAKEEDETTTDISFSPVSRDGKHRIVIGDVYDFQPAYLLDSERCKSTHLPLPRYVQPWVSWSPDGSKALFYTDYEASPQLWILKLDTVQILEVHHTGLAPMRDTC